MTVAIGIDDDVLRYRAAAFHRERAFVAQRHHARLIAESRAVVEIGAVAADVIFESDVGQVCFAGSFDIPFGRA